MRYISVFFGIVLLLSCQSCGHRPHGPRPVSSEDSLRRVTDMATKAHLAAIDTLHEVFEGPESTGTGEVRRGGRINTDQLDDSTASVVRSFEKFRGKIDKAQADSTTPLGLLLSRFLAIDTPHKYLSATYSSRGNLLTYHAEVTEDEKHKVDYDLYFDKGRLRFLHEHRTAPAEEEEQNIVTDDSYFMSADKVLFSYRDEGLVPLQDRTRLMQLTRYSLQGDLKGHAAIIFSSFLKDYQSLLSKPLELMVYMPPVRTPIPEAEPAKAAPSRGTKGF